MGYYLQGACACIVLIAVLGKAIVVLTHLLMTSMWMIDDAANREMCSSKTTSRILPSKVKIKGLLHGYEWGLRFGGLELRFG